tara:strand:+ start:228890 stop:229609 length:720 start_codon:yes stop_codon:yes gene_type:complete
MKFRERKKYPIEAWSNIIEGHPAFILGNGPSLLENDLTLIEQAFSIGLNRIYQVFDPTILLWQDKGLYRDGIHHLDNCAAIKCCRVAVDREGRWTNFRLESNPYKFHNKPHHLWGFGCSGALGVQLAVAMGANAIVMLGMDCDYEGPDKTDFYGKNEDHRPHTVRNFHKAAKWIQRDCPVPVYNCGRAKYWPRITLEEAVEKTQPTPVTRLQWLSRLSVEGEASGRYAVGDDRMGDCPL